MTDKNLTTIGNLLRQAEGTTNEHEREAFMQAAQRLATKSSIDLAVARAHTATREQRATPTTKSVTIGERGKRGLATYCTLFTEIATINGLQTDIAHNNTTVYPFGFAADIELTEALYSSLVVQMVHATNEYLASKEYRNETVERQNRVTYEWEVKPVHGSTARVNFQNAFIEAAARQLRLAYWRARSEAIDADTPTESGSTGTEIALRAAELEVADFYKQKSRARGSWRGNRAPLAHSNHARNAGREAGNRADVGGRRAVGAGQKAIG